MKKKLSVIVPVYNTSKYLYECLESICSQTFQDIEIICINDGSTDDSLDILKEFQQKDFRIIIIDQKNQGVSASRNAGLEIATGEYVGFVDSDDHIATDYFQQLITAAEHHNAEVVFTNAFSDDALEKNKRYQQEEIIRDLLPDYLRKDLYNSVCNKMYLNILIQKHHLRFILGKKLGEDATFNLNFLEFTTRLYYLDYAGYHYREVVGSATRNVSTQNYLEDAVRLFNEEPIDYVKKNITPQMIYDFKFFRFIHHITSLVYIYSEPGNGISLLQKFKKVKMLVHNNTVAKVFSEYKINADFGPYQKQIFNSIKNKSIVTLYFLSLYSYYRNL